MNNLDVAGLLRTYSERCVKSQNKEQLKKIISDLKRELNYLKIKN